MVVRWSGNVLPDLSFYDRGQRQEQVAQSAPAPGAASTIVATLPVGPRASELWLIDRIVVSSTSTTNTLATVYDGPNRAATDIIGATSQGNLDYDEPSYLYLTSSKVLGVTWSNASNGAVGTVRVFYRVYKDE